MEADPISEMLCSLEYWTMDKIQKLSNPQSIFICILLDLKIWAAILIKMNEQEHKT
jgi:hypothetical protein